MRNKIKFILLSCLLLTVILLATSCSSDQSPYKGYNKDGYTVSVKFDANGGIFTTNTETITDTYNLSQYTANSAGYKEIKLFDPNDPLRGGQAYPVSKENYYLAGWYTQKTPVTDESGNITGYTYSGLWDFENGRFSVKADEKYDSNTPVITLYAAWVPGLTYEFYTFGADGAPVLLSTTVINPTSDTTITLPAFNAETGMVNAPNSFPKLEGATYDKIYLDQAKTQEVTSATLTHGGRLVLENATLENPVKRIFCSTIAGVHYRIDTPEKLMKSANPNAYYTLEGDLDFTGKAWPSSFSTSTFSGAIIGNGHVIKNITATQNDTANTCFGLFGSISSVASVSDVTFENISVSINNGSNSQNATFGIFAGEISDGAKISNVTLQNSKIVISRSVYLKVALQNNPKFGLASAVGPLTGITFSQDNVIVAFPETGRYEYTYVLDAEGHFTLTEKQS